MSEIEFANGIYFNEPHENAPDFVLGSISVKPDRFTEWLAQQTPNEKGYVRLKVNMSKMGNPYVALDDWKPDAKAPDDFDDDFLIPF